MSVNKARKYKRMYKEAKAKFNSATREISELQEENKGLTKTQASLEAQVKEYQDKKEDNNEEISQLNFENRQLSRRFEESKESRGTSATQSEAFLSKLKASLEDIESLT